MTANGRQEPTASAPCQQTQQQPLLPGKVSFLPPHRPQNEEQPGPAGSWVKLGEVLERWKAGRCGGQSVVPLRQKPGLSHGLGQEAYLGNGGLQSLKDSDGSLYLNL